MFCTKCGAQISDYAEVCMNCGCETTNAKNKKESNEFYATENTLRLVFGIIFIIVFVVTLVGTLSYMLY